VVRWITGGMVVQRTTYDEDDFIPPNIEFPGYSVFSRMAKDAASKEDSLILGMVDTEYINLALNFYVSSILKHGIKNYLFVALHADACSYMAKMFPEIGERCFVFVDNHNTDKKVYDTNQAKHFKERIYLRRFFILEALKLRINVLVSDLDMVYLHNPLSDVRKECGRCDIAAIWDDHLETYDSGFMYTRATDKAITFFNRLASYELSHGSGQFAFNAALKDIKKKKKAILPMVVPLSTKKYKIGESFFEKNTCPEPKAYKGVLVVHNNYILETHNKIFRFKECMLWDLDGFDRYYTDPDRKYLTVETLGPRGYPEHQALLNAFSIAKLLRRTVILPRLECKKFRCNLLMRIYDHAHLHFIKHFHLATEGNYRESSFLQNPRVPTSTKDSLSPVFHITFRNDEAKPPSHGEPIQHLVPKDTGSGPTAKEIHDWRSGRPEKILRFDSLTGWFAHMKHVDLVGEDLVKVIRQL
jgi:hypothetical protein